MISDLLILPSKWRQQLKSNQWPLEWLKGENREKMMLTRWRMSKAQIEPLKKYNPLSSDPYMPALVSKVNELVCAMNRLFIGDGANVWAKGWGVRYKPDDFHAPIVDGGYLKHIVKEGSRQHVISYNTEGEHCSEPNCEINHKHKIDTPSDFCAYCRYRKPCGCPRGMLSDEEKAALLKATSGKVFEAERALVSLLHYAQASSCMPTEKQVQTAETIRAEFTKSRKLIEEVQAYVTWVKGNNALDELWTPNEPFSMLCEALEAK